MKLINNKKMANNNEQFMAFDDSITLSASCKNTLNTNRVAIGKKISKYFEDNYSNEISPIFWGQGSYMMDTILKPINDSSANGSLAAYDLDYGVYFIEENGKAKLSVDCYHKRVYNAVKDQTSLGATDKTTCVRVEYADGHHIDLPIYYKTSYGVPQLAHKSKGWIDSDPKEFYEWFNAKADVDPQLRRIVKYLKAWSDNVHYKNGSAKMPSGFVFTILASNNYYKDDRDDIAMCKTLRRMHNSLTSYFSCTRPTTPIGEEVLSSKFTDSQKADFLDRLDKFATSAEQAIAETNTNKGCLKWQKYFGDRFSCSTAKDEDEEARTFSQPAVLKRDGKNA